MDRAVIIDIPITCIVLGPPDSPGAPGRRFLCSATLHQPRPRVPPRFWSSPSRHRGRVALYLLELETGRDRGNAEARGAWVFPLVQSEPRKGSETPGPVRPPASHSFDLLRSAWQDRGGAQGDIPAQHLRPCAGGAVGRREARRRARCSEAPGGGRVGYAGKRGARGRRLGGRNGTITQRD